MKDDVHSAVASSEQSTGAAVVAPMNKPTLTALRGSIEKWRAIEAGTGDDRGHLNCPLCKRFFSKHDCRGCPVRERTGFSSCEGTPYDAWRNRIDGTRSAQTDGAKALARAEREFLESLLPRTTESRIGNSPDEAKVG